MMPRPKPKRRRLAILITSGTTRQSTTSIPALIYPSQAFRSWPRRLPQLRVADFIDSYLLQSSQLLWPVLEDEQLIGLISLEQVKDMPLQERATMTVGQLMRTDLEAMTLPADTDANRALLALGTHSSPLAVVEGNRVIGLLSQLDVMKWLHLHQQT